MVIGVIWFHLELKGFNSLRDYQTVATLLQDYEPLLTLATDLKGKTQRWAARRRADSTVPSHITSGED